MRFCKLLISSSESVPVEVTGEFFTEAMAVSDSDCTQTLWALRCYGRSAQMLSWPGAVFQLPKGSSPLHSKSEQRASPAPLFI